MVGIIAVTGSLVPMLILSPESVATIGGVIILLAMAVCLVGVINCARAGSMREQSQVKEEESKPRANFRMALIVCIISGLFSAMLNISLVVGLPIADMAVLHLEGPLKSFRSYNAVWLITLVGAFVPYIIYCVFLFIKNKSAQKYASEPVNFLRSALMGLLWFTCIALYGAGASHLDQSLPNGSTTKQMWAQHEPDNLDASHSSETVPDSSTIFVTVRQFRLVSETQRSFSARAASLELPTPSGACR